MQLCFAQFLSCFTLTLSNRFLRSFWPKFGLFHTMHFLTKTACLCVPVQFFWFGGLLWPFETELEFCLFYVALYWIHLVGVLWQIYSFSLNESGGKVRQNLITKGMVKKQWKISLKKQNKNRKTWDKNWIMPLYLILQYTNFFQFLVVGKFLILNHRLKGY